MTFIIVPVLFVHIVKIGMFLILPFLLFNIKYIIAWKNYMLFKFT